MSTPPPVLRRTARVLPVNPDREVLLLVITGYDGRPALMIPGAGLGPGESVLEAAARELEEETGFVADPGDLVGPIHDGTRERLDDLGVSHVALSRFVADCVERAEVSFAGQQTYERASVVGAEWVVPQALVHDDRVRYPPLPSVARASVAAITQLEGAP